MSHPTEDHVILAALESSLVDDGRIVRPVSEGDEVPVETLERIYTELLGLIPAELEPVEPRPELKDRILERVAADPQARPAATVTPHPRFLEARAGAAETETTPKEPRRGRSLRPWLLAAVVALAAIGASFFFYSELRQEQQETIAALQQQLDATSQRVELLAEGRVDVVEALRALSVSAPEAVDVCPLQPVGAEPVQPEAQGSLVLAMSQGRWYLRARDLAPTEGTRTYVLWFLDVDGQPIQRVALKPGDDRAVELRAEGIPMSLDAATITLEPSPDTVRPTGPQVLYGHRREMERL